MTPQVSVTPAFGEQLDSHQREELWEYDRTLDELGFPAKLRRELVTEYESVLRSGLDAGPTYRIG